MDGVSNFRKEHMKTTNIVLTIIAVAIIIFILWAGGFQKTPVAIEPAVNATVPATGESAVVKKITSEITNIKSMNTVILTTNKGVITLELYPDKAPKAVENFTKLSSEGFFNGVRFHRVIKGFMIQGGDPLSKDVSKKDAWGTGGPGYRFADEIDVSSELYKTGYKRGVLAMANSGPNTNGSQFFIMHQDYPLPPNYVIFGRVTSGLEVVDAIANAKTDSNDRPLDDMIIEKAEVK